LGRRVEEVARQVWIATITKRGWRIEVWRMSREKGRI
jgi:hypothetical protein